MLLRRGEAALPPVILQELLQGAASPDALKTLRTRFEALPMVMPRPGFVTYVEAGALFARCRWAGYTPRSPHDSSSAEMRAPEPCWSRRGRRCYASMGA